MTGRMLGVDGGQKSLIQSNVAFGANLVRSQFAELYGGAAGWRFQYENRE